MRLFSRPALAALAALLLGSTAAWADQLVVQRNVTLREAPTRNSEALGYPTPGTRLELLDEGRQQNGYYHVRMPDGREGWVYRTFVRREGDEAVLTPPPPPPPPPPGAAPRIWFGNLHSHTSYSDGSGTPDEAFAMAREAGLHFFAITEHNHDRAELGAEDRIDGKLIATDPLLYSGRPHSLVESAGRHDSAGRFVALYGQEFSTIGSGNHVNVFDVPAVIRVANGAYDRLAAFAASTRDTSGQKPLIQMNHPNDPDRDEEREDYGRDDFANDRAWVAAMDPLIELIEVLNAPATTDGRNFRAHRKQTQYLKYLDLGFHVAPSVGHDNHYRNWGVSTDARVAVLAPTLSKGAIMSALRRRHAYATEDKNLEIVFRANGALAGDIAAAPALGSALSLTVTLRDSDEPSARYRLEVLKDRPGDGNIASVAATAMLQGNTTSVLDLPPVSLGARGEYVLLRVTQIGGAGGTRDDVAWTAPVWFE